MPFRICFLFLVTVSLISCKELVPQSELAPTENELISLSLESPEQIQVGDQATVKLFANFSDNTRIDVSAEADWRSENPSVLDLDSNSLAIGGISKGTSRLSALYQHKEAQADVLVYEKIRYVPDPFIQGSGFDRTIYTIKPAMDDSGNIYVGGDFRSYNGIPVNRIARLLPTGELDTTFRTGNSGPNDLVNEMAPANDGTGDIYVAGFFTSFDGVAKGGIVRLNVDGSVDNDFNTGSGFNFRVHSLAVISGGSQVYVGGGFSEYKGSRVAALVRLNSDGSIDSGFNIGPSEFNSNVVEILLTQDGSEEVFVGGLFSSFRGVFSGLTKLKPNGDSSLVESAFSGGSVYGIAPTNNGNSIFVGGGFNLTCTGGAVTFLAKTGGTQCDAAFAANTSTLNARVSVLTSVGDASDDFFAGGDFTSFEGNGTGRIARMKASGELNSTYSFGAGFNGEVRGISVFEDGRILVGGQFTTYDDGAAGNLIRLKAIFD